jgi:hypothetical protein
MDALFAAPLFLVLVLVLVGLAATAGVDSRDGFGDDRLRQPYR